MLRLSETDVACQIDMKAAIAAVVRGLQAEHNNAAVSLPKNVLPYDDGACALHVLSAAAPGLGLSGVKTWVQAGATAQPILVLFDSETTELRAVIDAYALSTLRTGALAGIATDRLARKDADSLGVIGSGKQARSMIEAVASVRSLSRVHIWSPTEKNRVRLAQELQDRLGLAAVAVNSPHDAVDGAAIIGLAARAQAPLISAEMLAPGAHVNSIGVTTPRKSELPLEILARGDFICADSPATVRASSDEFKAWFDGKGNWDGLSSLANVVGDKVERPSEADLTIYKGMGSSIADLALGAALIG